MIYDRDILIDRVIELKDDYNKGKTQRSKGYLSYKILADICGVEERTIKKWLSKIPDSNGKFQNFTFPAIISLCNFFGCEIEYLLNKEMTCKTKLATDIHNATGLSEEAINILTGVDNGINKPDLLDISELFGSDEQDVKTFKEIEKRSKKDTEMDNIFRELINNIIVSYRKDRYFNMSFADLLEPPERDINIFPIKQMVVYIKDVRRNNRFKRHELSKLLLKMNRDSLKEAYGIGFTYLHKRLLEMGFDEEYIEDNIDLLTQSIIYEKFEKVDKRYRRIDIQDSFSDFLKSDFIEGEGNGK